MPWMENGFEICGRSTSPKNALEEIPRLNPHVVVCDLKMPGMDGISLIAQLKQQEGEYEFLMVSAYASFADSRDFFRNDGFDYLLKPLDALDIQIVLERLWRKLRRKYGPVDSRVTARGGKSKIDEIMAYISRNYNKKITLDLLSEQFHLNPSYICNLFTKHYGKPLRIFLTNFRMREAARMIEHTEKSLKVVAADCGYANYVYFCKVFKEFYGETPGEYTFKHRK